MRTDGRRFITVAIGMDSHPKIVDLSDKAFRLLIETWLWCAEHGTDGVVKASRWNKSATPKARRELIENGLVCIANDHFVMHDFLEHQQSKSDRKRLSEDRSEAASLGNHNRWHVARNMIKDDCPHCDDDHRKRIASAIANRSQTDRKPIAEVEVEKELASETTGDAHLGNARATRGRGASGPHSAAAYGLVDRVLGRKLTSGTRTALAIEVATLWPEATETELEAALRRWNARTGIGPRLLGALVDDLRKEAAGATTARAAPATPGISATDAHFAARLARYADDGDGRPPLLALPGGA